MRRSEFIELISKNMGTLSPSEVSIILDKFLEAFLDILLTTGRMELRGFGSFYIRNYLVKQSADARMFSLKKMTYKRVYFRAGKNFPNKFEREQNVEHHMPPATLMC